jgi:hypothetical protein
MPKYVQACSRGQRECDESPLIIAVNAPTCVISINGNTVASIRIQGGAADCPEGGGKGGGVNLPALDLIFLGLILEFQNTAWNVMWIAMHVMFY